MSLDDLFSRIEGQQTDPNLIGRRQGSIELCATPSRRDDQRCALISCTPPSAASPKTDVTLAAASDAIIIGFNVQPASRSSRPRRKKVDIAYRVIYQAIEDINAARVGLLARHRRGGHRRRRDSRDAKVPKGWHDCGLLHHRRRAPSRRQGSHRSRRHRHLRRRDRQLASYFKDDVKSVKQGYECGIGISGYQDLKVGDTIEGYIVKEVERTE